MMTGQKTVSHLEWVEARKALLEKEKKFTSARDALSAEIRNLPREKVEKDYFFDSPDGPESLGDLFDGNNQLIVYHFMYDPVWEEGCKSCSLIADHFDPLIVHLRERDVAMVAVGRAPLEKLDAFKRRMGWDFKWVSAEGNDFNWDYHVSFTAEQTDAEDIYYNYRPLPGFGGTELPGLSVFSRDDNGDIFHTYSCYSRGLETFLGVYRLLDVVPKGRDEAGLSHGMAWVRHHDRYGVSAGKDRR